MRPARLFLRGLRRSSTVVVLTAAMVGCGDVSQPFGYWEGKGTAMELPMNDAVRKLERSATYEFWFTLAETGEALGKIELKYDAELKVEGLPSVSVPGPGGISATFKPEVGGSLTDLDPTREFLLVGMLEDRRLTLAIATPDDARPPLEFTIRADAGISGGLSVGDGSVGDLPSGTVEVIVHKIEMTPFSPFRGGVEIEKRAGGPFAVRVQDKGENFAIEWSARQVRSARTALELTPELQDALRRLKDSL